MQHADSNQPVPHPKMNGRTWIKLGKENNILLEPDKANMLNMDVQSRRVSNILKATFTFISWATIHFITGRLREVGPNCLHRDSTTCSGYSACCGQAQTCSSSKVGSPRIQYTCPRWKAPPEISGVPGSISHMFLRTRAAIQDSRGLAFSFSFFPKFQRLRKCNGSWIT